MNLEMFDHGVLFRDASQMMEEQRKAVISKVRSFWGRKEFKEGTLDPKDIPLRVFVIYEPWRYVRVFESTLEGGLRDRGNPFLIGR